jgi:hypothetical protein
MTSSFRVLLSFSNRNLSKFPIYYYYFVSSESTSFYGIETERQGDETLKMGKKEDEVPRILCCMSTCEKYSKSSRRGCVFTQSRKAFFRVLMSVESRIGSVETLTGITLRTFCPSKKLSRFMAKNSLGRPFFTLALNTSL